MVHGLANQLISHRRGNGNKTQRGFVQGLIDSANAVNSLLEITRDDVRNEVNLLIIICCMLYAKRIMIVVD